MRCSYAMRCRVGDEPADFFRRGRQPDQIERHAPDERAFIGFRRRLESLRFELLKNECVNLVANPASVIDGGQFCLAGLLQRPQDWLFADRFRRVGGSDAPSRIQSSKSATVSGGRGLPGGIFNCLSV